MDSVAGTMALLDFISWSLEFQRMYGSNKKPSGSFRKPSSNGRIKNSSTS
jgi:hypothetical protein